MNLPHSAHGFLEDAVMSLKHGGTVHLYFICERSGVDGFVEGLISELREVGIDLEIVRLEELKTYSPTTSVYSTDLVLTHRPSSTV
jgi:tRNA (guanine37-N1)-methyltransferase